MAVIKADCLGTCKRKQVPSGFPCGVCPYCGGALGRNAAPLPVSLQLALIADASSTERRNELKMRDAIDYHLKREIDA